MQILLLGVLMFAIFAIVLYLFHRVTTPRPRLEFIEGFSRALLISYDEAQEKWQDFTRLHPERKHIPIERASYHDGYVQGLDYIRMERGE